MLKRCYIRLSLKIICVINALINKIETMGDRLYLALELYINYRLTNSITYNHKQQNKNNVKSIVFAVILSINK